MARVCRCFFLLVVALAVGRTTAAQVTRGVPDFGSFSGSPTDTINLANLNSHVTIPILHKPGRGLNADFDLTLDSSVWTPLVSSGNSVWSPASDWGWNGTSVLFGSVTYTTTTTLTTCSGGGSANTLSYSNWTYSDPKGDHPFPGVSDTYDCTNTTDGFSGVISTDDSGYTLTTNGTTFTLSGRGGTIISVPGKTPRGFTGPPSSETLTDRNGNEITVNDGVFTDTLDTTALTIAGALPNPVTFSYTAPSGSAASVTVTFKTYVVQTNFGCAGTSEYGPLSNSLVDRVTLPDGSYYSFQYEPTPGSSGNVTGRLASLTLPTKGTITYTYTGGSNGIVCVDGSTAGLTRQTSDGIWTYERTVGPAGTSTTTITDPTAQQNQTVSSFQGILETQRQIYQGSAGGGALLETISHSYNTASPFFPVSSESTTITQPDYSCSNSISYNNFGLPTSMVQSLCDGSSTARTTTYSYMQMSNSLNAFWQEVSVSDGGLLVSDTKYSYDQTTPTSTSTLQHASVTGSRGNLTSIQYSTGATTLTKTISYFDTGTIHQVTDVNGGVTTFAYGACNNSFPTSETLPVSTLSFSYAWNCTGGVLTQATDQNGKVTNTSYTDPDFWRPSSVTDATGATVNFTYANPNTTESSLLFNGSSTVDVLTTLDGLGRVVLSQTKQSPGSSLYDSVETDYDAAGRPSRVALPYSAPAGQLCQGCPGVTTSYDSMGRALQVTDSGGGTTSYSYNANDVLVTTGPAATGEHVKARQIEYDALGRVISVCEVSTYYGSGPCGQATAATGFPTAITHDGNDYESYQGGVRPITSVSANPFAPVPQTRTYSVDELGRLLSFTFPEFSGVNVYDTDTTCSATFSGDLVRHTDPVGNTTCYHYDAMHRPLSITYSGPYATSTPNKYFVYDSATVSGTAMSNAKGQLAEAYTATCQTCSKITDLGFSYSARGELTDVYESTPNSGGYYHVNAQYLANGALSQLSDLPGMPTISFSPDGEGRPSIVSASSGKNPVLSTIYNAASQPLSVKLGSGDSDAFGYDPKTYRMTQYTFNVNSKSVTGSLTWSPNGTLQNLNITDPFNAPDTQSCAYIYDDMARVCSANCGSIWQQTFSYDQFGNISKNGTSSFQPTYNLATNRMSEVGSSAPSYDANGNVLNDFLHGYTWDAAGRPVKIDGLGVTYDALGRMVEQLNSGIYSQIVYAPTGQKFALMGGQTLQKAFVPLPGGLTAVYESGGLTYYRHPDWQGSSRFASTSSQGFYSSTAYAPFGEPYAQAGTPDVSFTGQNQDTVPNLYDFPAREYGIQGRWPSPDPYFGSIDSTNPQSFNRYAYLGNSPLNHVDPSGLDSFCQPTDCSGGNGGGGTSYYYYYNGGGNNGGGNNGGSGGQGGSGGGSPHPVAASAANLNSISSSDSYDPPVGMDIWHNSAQCPGCGNLWQSTSANMNLITAVYAGVWGGAVVGVAAAAYGPALLAKPIAYGTGWYYGLTGAGGAVIGAWPYYTSAGEEWGMTFLNAPGGLWEYLERYGAESTANTVFLDQVVSRYGAGNLYLAGPALANGGGLAFELQYLQTVYGIGPWELQLLRF
jgi:RHS repeat-associated protein